MKDPSTLTRHTMLSRDIETMTGVCRICGPVQLHQRSKNMFLCGSYRRDARNEQLMKLYGITIADYRVMVTERASQCDICHESFESLHVDHDHTDGHVRGLLCGNCNRAIGIMKDDVQRLRSAIAYLERT